MISLVACSSRPENKNELKMNSVERFIETLETHQLPYPILAKVYSFQLQGITEQGAHAHILGTAVDEGSKEEAGESWLSKQLQLEGMAPDLETEWELR